MKKTWFLLAALSLMSVVPALAGDLIDNKDWTVTDNVTGLMWQQTEGGSMTWEEALAYCEGLSLAGSADWRLPNVKELESLTDDSRYQPAIDTTFFPDVVSNLYVAPYYWSSTSGDFNTSSSTPYAWNVYFHDGNVLSSSKTNNFYVRCVR